MYKKIMVPVDLAHVDKLARALDTAANLAKFYHAPVTYVGVTSSAQTGTHGIQADGKTVVSHDPAVDLDDALIKAVDETGSDLVVMATHIPNVADHIWPSNGGRIATHTNASVFLVRG